MTEPLLTTAEVAEEIRMSQDWVRENAGALGGIRIGQGCRAPLRFERARIEQYKEQQRLEPPARAPRKPHRPGRRRAPSGVELIPLPQGH